AWSLPRSHAVPEEFLYLVVFEAAGDDAGNTEGLGALEPAQVDVASADDDLAAHLLRERLRFQHGTRGVHAEDERRPELSPETEDPLDQRRGRLHAASLTGMHLDDPPVDVGVDLDRDGARLHDHLARDGRDALDRSADDRLPLAPTPSQGP